MHKIVFNNNVNNPVYFIVNIESGKLIKECYSQSEAEKELAEINFLYSFSK